MTTCRLESPKSKQASCKLFSSALDRSLQAAARAKIRPSSRSGPAAMRSRVRSPSQPACHGGVVRLHSDALPHGSLESDLRGLSDWQRRYLPNIHAPLGQQVLAWLIRNRDQPRPFSHLLVSTSFSPTSVRHLLNQFAVLGLVEVPKAPVACRRGNIVATLKLKERLEEYAERMDGIISHHRGIGSTSSGGTPSAVLD